MAPVSDPMAVCTHVCSTVLPAWRPPVFLLRLPRSCSHLLMADGWVSAMREILTVSGTSPLVSSLRGGSQTIWDIGCLDVGSFSPSAVCILIFHTSAPRHDSVSKVQGL